MNAPQRLTTLISTKGQVIIPKAIRDHRHWTAGTKLTIEETSEGVLLKPVATFRERSVDEVFGMLKRDGPALTLEEMDAGVMREAQRRARD
jgi:AbrB family looped-hinge helix DNA binding protein